MIRGQIVLWVGGNQQILNQNWGRRITGTNDASLVWSWGLEVLLRVSGEPTFKGRWICSPTDAPENGSDITPPMQLWSLCSSVLHPISHSLSSAIHMQSHPPLHCPPPPHHLWKQAHLGILSPVKHTGKTDPYMTDIALEPLCRKPNSSWLKSQPPKHFPLVTLFQQFYTNLGREAYKICV